MRQIKKTWDDEAVSPVIATILMVAITVVLAGVLVLYMQNFSSGPGGSTSTALVNVNYKPEDAVVDGYNGGYWVASIESIDKQVTWSDVEILVQDSNGILLAKCSSKTAPYSKGSTAATTNMGFWICENSAGSARFDPVPATNGSTPVQPSTTNKPTKDSFVTLAGSTILIVDNDANDKMSTGDVAYVFRDFDNNSLTSADVPENSELIFKSAGSNIAKKTLSMT